ncbi:hypothetical protein MSPP1_003949 [Malassezia sp. CBS 17886]|nr:hypothetical protein MSPP1_003949 [Malassezia sp. CBS 17886]
MAAAHMFASAELRASQSATEFRDLLTSARPLSFDGRGRGDAVTGAPVLQLQGYGGASGRSSPDASADEDDVEVMESLREARRRLNDVSLATADADHSALADLGVAPAREPLSRPQRQSAPSPVYLKERSRSQPVPAARSVLQRRRTSNATNPTLPETDLVLDLHDLPLPTFATAAPEQIEAARAAHQQHASDAHGAADATGAPWSIPTAHADPAASVPMENSGSRYGLAPYTALEREEWVWQPEAGGNKDCLLSPFSCDTHGDAHLAPRPRAALHKEGPSPSSSWITSSAEAEWSWALSCCQAPVSVQPQPCDAVRSSMRVL